MSSSFLIQGVPAKSMLPSGFYSKCCHHLCMRSNFLQIFCSHQTAVKSTDHNTPGFAAGHRSKIIHRFLISLSTRRKRTSRSTKKKRIINFTRHRRRISSSSTGRRIWSRRWKKKRKERKKKVCSNKSYSILHCVNTYS